LAKEDYKTAEQIIKKVERKFSESFSPLGMLYIGHKQQGEATNYSREPDISKTICLSYFKDTFDIILKLYKNETDEKKIF
jgi:hypothetical protein